MAAGAGAETRNSIGIILVAGMLIGTLFTRLILASLYLKLATTHKPQETSEQDTLAASGGAALAAT